MDILFAAMVGAIAGLATVGFVKLVDGSHTFFLDWLNFRINIHHRANFIWLPAIGGLIVGLFMHFLAREAHGHGVPEVISAIRKRGGIIAGRLAVTKALASAVTIGSGGSAGHEGPVVQIGASLGSTIAQQLRLTQDLTKALVTCGSAGGIAAVLNAPFAGSFFALEVVLGNFGFRFVSMVATSAFVATIVTHPFLGNNPAFSVPQFPEASSFQMFSYGILGILAAIIAVIYIASTYRIEHFFNKLRVAPFIKPALGGLCVGGLALYSGLILGTPLAPITNAVAGQYAIGMVFALMWFKILATGLTVGSGGSGGLFFPSLFIGAMFGAGFGAVVHHITPGLAAPAGAYALVGMAAVLTGSIRAPVTAILAVIEMTKDYNLLFPLLVATALGTIVAHAIHRPSIYTRRLEEGELWLPQYQVNGSEARRRT